MKESPVKFGRETFIDISDRSLREKYECTKQLGKGDMEKFSKFVIKQQEICMLVRNFQN